MEWWILLSWLPKVYLELPIPFIVTFPALWLTCISSTQFWLLHITQFSIFILCLPASFCFTSVPGLCFLCALSCPFIAAAEVRTLRLSGSALAGCSFCLRLQICSVSWWSGNKIPHFPEQSHECWWLERDAILPVMLPQPGWRAAAASVPSVCPHRL